MAEVSRWQLFKHRFERCRGPVFKREYIRPRPMEVEGDPVTALRVMEEARFGVTLVHCRCDTCGETFTNRELGDTRPDPGGERG